MGSLSWHLLLLPPAQPSSRMKVFFVTLSLMILQAVAWRIPAVEMEDGSAYPVAEGLEPSLQQPQGLSAVDRELLAEYLASLGAPAPGPEQDLGGRAKRRWWGNKYRDNKSYGFWITPLNKAGNWKRGKRSVEDFLTGPLSPVPDSAHR